MEAAGGLAWEQEFLHAFRIISLTAGGSMVQNRCISITLSVEE